MVMSMKGIRIAVGLFFLMLISHAALAQDDLPRWEAFAGFSYLPAGPEDFPRDNSYGVQGSIAGNLTRWFGLDRKSTRLNSSHLGISYAVFCLKKKNE